MVSLEEAIRRSGLKDGMTVSFHHHFRGGDKVLNMVMDKIAETLPLLLRIYIVEDLRILPSGVLVR